MTKNKNITTETRNNREKNSNYKFQKTKNDLKNNHIRHIDHGKEFKLQISKNKKRFEEEPHRHIEHIGKLSEAQCN